MNEYELERAAAAAAIADYETYGDPSYLEAARFHLAQARRLEVAQSPSI
jgi:hypothetical protein